MGVLKFDYMHENTVCTHVEVDLQTKQFSVENFTKIKARTVFAKREPNIENLVKFFEERCFPRNRQDEKEILTYLGLTQYDPLSIVRVTKGALHSDHCWIRFDGDKSTWKEVKEKLDKEHNGIL